MVHDALSRDRGSSRRGGIGRKGTPYRRVIRTIVVDGREFYLHATKGWRVRRA